MELIVSHDAGGAELISNWIKYKKIKKNFYFCTDGPAKNIFRNNIGNFKNIPFENVRKLKIKKIITGTSWDSNLENKAIIYGKKKLINTVSYLDHWNNYIERFIYKGKLILPEEINVVDKYAYSLAKKKFKNTKIKRKKNYYQFYLLKKLKPKKTKKILREKILYLSEPIYEHAKKQHGDGMYWGYEETFLIKRFLQNVNKLCKNKFTIYFRKHPSEKKEKYVKIINKYKKKFDIKFSNKGNLYEDINRSSIIVGNQSMAMAMAIDTKKKIYSILPNPKHKVLPHKNIKYI